MADEFEESQKDEQQQAASRAVVELHGRLVGKGSLEPGTKASNGWSMAAHYARDAGPFATTCFWAMLSPEGGRLVIIGHDDIMTYLDVVTHDEMKQYIEAAQVAVNAASEFAASAERADPVRRAERAAAIHALLENMHSKGRSTQTIGSALLHLKDGEPKRAEGVVALDSSGAVVAEDVTVERVDHEKDLSGAPVQGERLSVWTRPIGNGLGRRGRLRLEETRIVFIDEPEASGSRRGNGKVEAEPWARSLEQDLKTNELIKTKVQNSEVYADLLYRALENATYQHLDGTVFQGGMRSTGELVFNLVDGGWAAAFYLAGTPHVLDEQVLADLRALGWLPVVSDRGELRLSGEPVPAGTLSAEEQAELAAYDAEPGAAGEVRPFPAIHRGRLAWRHPDGALRTGRQRDSLVIGGA